MHAVIYSIVTFAQGKHVIGKVEEKEAAHKAYKEAVSQGHGAYLLDEEKPDVFSVSIGNLPPKADIVIKIKYITELSVDGDDVSLTTMLMQAIFHFACIYALFSQQLCLHLKLNLRWKRKPKRQ